MDWGMANRMAHVIKSDGRCMFLPIDHGYFQGPTRNLEKPGETIAPLLPYSDALFVTRGVLRSSVDPGNSKPIILRVSGGTSMVGQDLANEGVTTSMEEALRLNVSAVGLSVFIGTEYEHQTLMSLSKLVNEGEKYGIPVMAVTAVGRELERRDARYLGLCCRIAAELGARVVKTYWCEDFEKVRRWLPCSCRDGGWAPGGHGARGAGVRPRWHAKGRGRREPGKEHLAERVPRGDDQGYKVHSPREWNGGGGSRAVPESQGRSSLRRPPLS